MSSYDVVVIGGGPAGTAAAIRAAGAGARVLLLERGRLPRQKVCGEFVSAEGVEILRELDGAVAEGLLAAAPRISGSRLFVDGQCVAVPIEPEAASITRSKLDAALWQAAQEAGTEARQGIEVVGVWQSGAGFVVRCTTEYGGATEEIDARAVVDASGRWSKLRAAEGGAPSGQPAGRRRYLGVKAHFRRTDGPAGVGRPTVDLYFFRGGYCGVQPIEGGLANACAMVRADVASSIDEALRLHPALRECSRDWKQVGEAVATSPLVFEKPRPVRGGVLCAGDAAGFVDPFVGDGITLALGGGRLAAEAALEHDVRWYEEQYRARLGPVFGNASWLRRVMGLPAVLRRPIVSTLKAPFVGRMVVQATRAK